MIIPPKLCKTPPSYSIYAHTHTHLVQRLDQGFTKRDKSPVAHDSNIIIMRLSHFLVTDLWSDNTRFILYIGKNGFKVPYSTLSRLVA